MRFPMRVPPPLAILSIALSVRLLVMCLALLLSDDPAVFHTLDTVSYALPAQELLSAGSFSILGVPEIVRTPGYPLFLIPGLVAGHMNAITLILQILVSCATVYVVYKLALAVTDDETTARLAGLFYAFEPLSVLYSVKLMPETLFALLLALSMYCLTVSVRRGSLRYAIGASFLIAGATYVKPVSYYLPIFLALGVALIGMAIEGITRKTLALSATILLVGMSLLVPWQIRNWAASGYTGFSAIYEINMYYGEAASVLAARSGRPYEETQRGMGYLDDEMYYSLHPDQRAENASGRYAYMRAEGNRILLSSPATYCFIRARGTLQVLINPGGAEYTTLLGIRPPLRTLEGNVLDEGVTGVVLMWIRHHRDLLLINLALASVLLVWYTCSALSPFSRPPDTRKPMLVVASVILYLVLVSGGAAVTSRYRHPIMPLLAPFAACGVTFARGWSAERKRSSRRPA